MLEEISFIGVRKTIFGICPFKDFIAKIFPLRSHGLSKLSEVSLRVGVLLSHISLSALKGLSLDVVSSLREQIAQVVKLVLVDAHENDVW